MFKRGDIVFEKFAANIRIRQGKIVDKFGEKYAVEWEEIRHDGKKFYINSFREERDLIPIGDPNIVLKEIL